MYFEDSDDGVVQQQKVHIKPRRITKDTPQKPEGDFFSRKPHVLPESWGDALEMWKRLFHTETIDNLPIKIVRQKVRQALIDLIKNFCYNGSKSLCREWICWSQ